MVLGIEVLRVIAFPPLAFAVGLGEFAVIGDACFRSVDIISLCGFIPGPGMVGMKGDAEWQTVLLGSLGPPLYEVALRSDVHRVPLLVFGIPKVEVVMMVAEHKEILRPEAFVSLDEFVGIPFLCLEQGQDILEAHLRRMAIVLQMMPIGV